MHGFTETGALSHRLPDVPFHVRSPTLRGGGIFPPSSGRGIRNAARRPEDQQTRSRAPRRAGEPGVRQGDQITGDQKGRRTRQTYQGTARSLRPRKKTARSLGFPPRNGSTTSSNDQQRYSEPSPQRIGILHATAFFFKLDRRMCV